MQTCIMSEVFLNFVKALRTVFLECLQTLPNLPGNNYTVTNLFRCVLVMTRSTSVG